MSKWFASDCLLWIPLIFTLQISNLLVSNSSFLEAKNCCVLQSHVHLRYSDPEQLDSQYYALTGLMISVESYDEMLQFKVLFSNFPKVHSKRGNVSFLFTKLFRENHCNSRIMCTGSIKLCLVISISNRFKRSQSKQVHVQLKMYRQIDFMEMQR